MSTSYDWSKFIVRININAPVEKLYKAWATREGMEYWFLRLCEYKQSDGSTYDNAALVKAGDSYKWLWYGYGDDTAEHGEILEANGKDVFKFRFGKAGDCTVRIFTEENETIVELVQDNIPTDGNGMHSFHVGCNGGWTFYLANMKSLYEGGIDLRNRNEKLKRMINS